jgi:hypothetical protein
MFVLSAVVRKHVSKLLRKTLIPNTDIKYWEIDGGDEAYIQNLWVGEKLIIKWRF